MGKLAEGKTVDEVCDKLKDFKELYYTKYPDSETLFFVIKRVP